MTAEHQTDVVGAVDGWSLEKISGWAYVRGRQQPATVELLIDGVIVDICQANRFRKGLLEGGSHPTGLCGFVLTVPAGGLVEAGQRIHVRVMGVSGSLQRAQCLVVRDSVGRLGLEALPDRLWVVDGEGDAVNIPSFRDSAPRSSPTVFVNSIGALFLREVSQRYGASRFGYPWAIAQPLLALAVLVFAHRMFAGSDATIYGVSSTYFLMIGVMPFFLFLQAYHQAMGAVASGRGTLNYPSVRPFDLVLVRCGIEAMIMIVVILLSIVGVWWTGGRMEARDPLGFIAVTALLFVMSMGLGLIADVEITRNDDARRIFSLIERPLFFLSGVFYSINVVPEPARGWLMWNPLLHAIDLGRGAMLRGYVSPCSWVYLSLWSFGLLCLGLAMYRRHLPRLLSA